jgi:ubiquinone/menaquinone biosynthesis C-methylase UbiE
MIWLVIPAVILLIPVVVAATRPMKIPREPDREGLQENDAVAAYYRTSRWPIFIVERNIMSREINKDQPSGIIIDIGCGPGFLSERISKTFHNSEVIGLDLNEEMIDIAEKRWPPSLYDNLEFLVGDGERMPFADNSIDYIVSSLSLHHWKNAERAFTEMYRVLKPGGQVIVFDLRRNSPRWFYYALHFGQAISPRAIRRTNGAVGSFWSSYTPNEIGKILAGTPFKECTVGKQFGWLLIRCNKTA